MFNNITKILQSIKKGVIIVENDKPRYVLIPWEDVVDNDITIGVNNNKIDSLHFKDRDAVNVPFIDDASMIAHMVDDDSSRYLDDVVSEEKEIAEILNQIGDKNNSNTFISNDDTQVNLENLPF